MDNLARFRGILSLALAADQTKMMRAIQDMLNAVERTTTGLHIDGQRDRIRMWLSAPDPSLNHNAARAKRHANTGSWLIDCQKFADWKRNAQSFMWLHGIPGCGKSVLSSTLIDNVETYCRQSPGRAMAYFYFDFSSKDNEKQKYENMIRSLVAQLSLQDGRTSQTLVALYSKCREGEEQPRQMDLVEVLQELIQKTEDTFIILDALDECTDRDGLMRVLQGLSSRGDRLHLLATSRDEKDIREGLESLCGGDNFIKIQSNLVNEDIQSYIHARLEDDSRFSKWKAVPGVKAEIEKAMMEKVDGM